MRFANINQKIDDLRKFIANPNSYSHMEHRADALYELSVSLLENLDANVANSIEEAIAYLKEAQLIYKVEVFPHQWASVQLALGNAYRERMKGNMLENFNTIFEFYSNALQVFTRENHPTQWAKVQMNLGIAYFANVKGSKSQNLADSIDSFENALKIFNGDNHAEDWAKTNANLALAYKDISTGDKTENLEKCISTCGNALQIFTFEGNRYQWACIQLNLGVAYAHRTLGDKSDNIRKAITHHRNALLIYTKRKHPNDYATIQNNLGNDYLKRISRTTEANVKKSVKSYENAIRIHTKTDFPSKWAMIQNNLGTIYLKLTNEAEIENIQKSIIYLQNSLTVYNKEEYPYEWARSHKNLGELYTFQDRKDQEADITNAIAHYQNALEVYIFDDYPFEHIVAAKGLGRVLCFIKDFSQARKILEKAHLSLEIIRNESLRDDTKMMLSNLSGDLYRFLTYSCLVSEDFKSAFSYMAFGKGRALVDRLTTTKDSFRKLIATNDKSLLVWKAIQAHRENINRNQCGREEAEIELSFLDNKIRQAKLRNKTEELKHLEKEKADYLVLCSEYIKDLSVQRRLLKEELEKLQSIIPPLAYTQLTPSLEISDAQELSTLLGATLIEYYNYEAGWVVFIIKNDKHKVFRLPENTNTIIDNALKWIKSFDLMEDSDLSNENFILTSMYETFIQPIAHLLNANERLLIAPCNFMHLLPLGLCKKNDKTYLIDTHTLTFTPSLSAFKALYEQREKLDNEKKISKNERLLSVAYSDNHDSPYHLPGVLPEVKSVANYFSETISLHEIEATPKAVIDICHQESFSALHFACHGVFDYDSPGYSGLRINGLLTTEQILLELHLKGYPLVTLSACHTGQSRIGDGDELVGLSYSFLTAGAGNVIASLWKVDDNATMCLFKIFYEERNKSGISDSQALKNAMMEIRKKNSSARIWGAFQITGFP